MVVQNPDDRPLDELPDLLQSEVRLPREVMTERLLTGAEAKREAIEQPIR
jgi:hypothetical protein